MSDHDETSTAELRARLDVLEAEIAGYRAMHAAGAAESDGGLTEARGPRASTACGQQSDAEDRQSRQLQLLATQLMTAEQRERRRLARILHEDLQQLLVAARMTVERGQDYVRQGDGDVAGDILVRAIQLIDESIESSRAMSHELCPAILYDRGLAPALSWLADDFSRHHDLQVTTDISQPAAPADQNIEAFLFQTVRELLLDAARHGRTGAHIVMQATDALATITVEDDGASCEPVVPVARTAIDGAFDVIEIGERLRLLGGAVVIEAAPDTACRVLIRCPLRPNLAALAEPAVLPSGNHYASN